MRSPLQGTSKERKRVVIRGVENGGESGDTTHHTQAIPRRHEPLDGRTGSQWSSLPTSDGGAQWWVPIIRLLHSTHVHLINATSYSQKVEAAPYKAFI